jgi:hypothetical protein
MITASKLKQLSSINADQLTEILLDSGHDSIDEPFINTCFDAVDVNGKNLNFIYEAMYAHVDGGVQYARVIVEYNAATNKISAELSD